MEEILSEKAMAPHYSTLAWKIPWTEEPGRLQSMGSLGIGVSWKLGLSIGVIHKGYFGFIVELKIRFFVLFVILKFFTENLLIYYLCVLKSLYMETILEY